MKKLVLVLAVLLVSLPAMAAVTITATCDEGVYTVSYANTGAVLPRAFALDITVATGTITGVSDFSPDFDIYPGSIVIENGEVSAAGSAVCSDTYPGTLGGIGTNGVTIEMASLYAAGETEPNDTGVLFTFTTSEAVTTATVAINAIRGGVVMEDTTAAALTFVVNDCEDITPPVCLGDLNGDGFIRTNDLGALVTLLNDAGAPYRVGPTSPLWNPAADINGDGFIRTNDLGALVTMLNDAGAPYRIPCP